MQSVSSNCISSRNGLCSHLILQKCQKAVSYSPFHGFWQSFVKISVNIEVGINCFFYSIQKKLDTATSHIPYQHFMVNCQRSTSVMRRSELKILTLGKWPISLLVRMIIKICRKHRTLKPNSNSNIYNET